jgi:uncharacterized protein YkwD
MQFNWIDWVIIIIFAYEAYQGWVSGFVSLGASVLALAVSLWLAIAYQTPVSSFFIEKFGVAPTWGLILSYMSIVFLGQIIFMQILHLLVARIPKQIANSKINSALGAIVSWLNSLTIVAFVIIVLLALPLRGTIKKDIESSVIGGKIAAFTKSYEGPLKVSLNEFQKKATKFFTIKPDSKESMALDVAPKSSDLEISDVDEKKMLALVNAERAKVGAPALVVDVTIVQVARNHSRDMFMRRYFSHVTPDAKDPADRMQEGGVKFSMVGENLAYAPDAETAHQGLMDSPEHKKNILDPQFHRIGIGIITTQSFGMMVTQDFAN